jgi:hypothetical protein
MGRRRVILGAMRSGANGGPMWAVAMTGKAGTCGRIAGA